MFPNFYIFFFIALFGEDTFEAIEITTAANFIDVPHVRDNFLNKHNAIKLLYIRITKQNIILLFRIYTPAVSPAVSVTVFQVPLSGLLKIQESFQLVSCNGLGAQGRGNSHLSPFGLFHSLKGLIPPCVHWDVASP